MNLLRSYQSCLLTLCLNEKLEISNLAEIFKLGHKNYHDEFEKLQNEKMEVEQSNQVPDSASNNATLSSNVSSTVKFGRHKDGRSPCFEFQGDGTVQLQWTISFERPLKGRLIHSETII